jgi:hypothetical protein
MSDQLIEYRSVLHLNGEVFLFNYKEEFAAFGFTDQYFDKFSKVISTKHMKNGKTLIGLIPLLMIMQRQYRNAFQSITVFQSYQSWVLLRPAIESALIMGKWLDDLNNFDVWIEHQDNWKNYQKIYQGKNLVSDSLPNSAAIQSVLKRINDDFMHTNPSYYKRHSQIIDLDEQNVGMFVNFTDDEQDHRAHTYAFLYLTLFILKQVGLMLSDRYAEQTSFTVNLDKLHDHFASNAREIANRNEEYKKLLLELGLWPNQSLNQTGANDAPPG